MSSVVFLAPPAPGAVRNGQGLPAFTRLSLSSLGTCSIAQVNHWPHKTGGRRGICSNTARPEFWRWPHPMSDVSLLLGWAPSLPGYIYMERDRTGGQMLEEEVPTYLAYGFPTVGSIHVQRFGARSKGFHLLPLRPYPSLLFWRPPR